MISSKRQFLDPIGAGCRLMLLHFAEAGTKLRIINHTMQLVSNNHTERLLYRPWLYGDSRDDMCVLYPMIIRFIELYLIEKKEKRIEQKDSPDRGNMMSFLDNNQSDNDNENEVANAYSEKCYICLKKMAMYMIRGISCLEKTYDYDNAVFTLKYFSNLLRSGVNGTYNSDMLPEHLKDLTTHNLLDISKIKKIWKDADIIGLSELFEKCFEAHENNNIEMLKGYKAAIMEILNTRDEEFRKMVNSTDCA